MSSASDLLSKEDHERIFRERIMPEERLAAATSLDSPKAIILGGQPGAGKGGLARAASSELRGDVIAIDPDALREFHPDVDRFREQNPYQWSGRTHMDASGWADEALGAASDAKKNLIFDTTLSNGEWASDSLIKGLQEKGYQVEVRVVASPKLESELGVDQRFTDSLDRNGFGRHVPQAARDAIYEKTPASLDFIHTRTHVPIRIFNREGEQLYDSRTDSELRSPGQALTQERDARLHDPRVSQQLREDWHRQAEWHRGLPEHAKDIPRMDATKQSALLGEQAQANSVEFAAIRAEGSATVDALVRPGSPVAQVPNPESAMPALRRGGSAVGLAGLGLAASAYDARETGHRVSELLQHHNPTAAQSELSHFAARGIGGWVGGTLAVGLVGSSGAAPLALVAADSYLFSKALENAAALHDSHAIYRQRDGSGIEWQYDGRNWVREASLDRTPDGVDNPQNQSVAADYQKARELSARASVVAAELALGKLPAPQDPFNIPAQAGDQRGLDNQNWQLDDQTDQWIRQMKTGVTGANDRGTYATEVASQARSGELDQEARERIARNITHGRESVAAAYLETHAALRSEDFIKDVPAAVQYARATPDVVQGSDGLLYRRNVDGAWLHNGTAAQGNLAVELELTQKIREPWLDQSNAYLDELQSRPAPTPADVERSELLHRYQTYGVRVPDDWLPAIEQATQRTRDAAGITGRTMQELQRGESGFFGADSSIVHYQTGSDGIGRQVATTSTEEIRGAYAWLQDQQAVQAPVPDSPELRIAALSPDEREAYQQALREANRQGVSTQEAQQVASFAAVSVHAPLQGEAHAPQAALDLEQQRDAVPAPSIQPQTSQPVAAAAMAAAPGTAPPTEPERLQQASPRVQREEPRTGTDPRESAKATDEASQRVSQRSQQAEASPASTVTAHQAAEVQPPAAHPQQAPQEREDSVQQGPPLAPEPSPDASIIAASAQQAPPLQQPPAEGPVTEPASHPLPAASAQQLPRVPTQHESETEQQPVYSAATSTAATAVADEAQTLPRHSAQLQPDHPDHALYQQVRDGVAALDAKHGREFDETSERMSASLLVLAKDSGLDRVDHVLLSQATPESHAGKNLFVVQGEPDNPAHLRASIPTEKAAQTPVGQSLEQFEVVSQKHAQATLERQQEHAQLDQVQQQDAQARSMGMR
ncbi:zeta toxin family protein [Stenotrophomonas sp. 169]|uniref:zeta toxin family protein n=1 Tax=Stenotrophomonas sp. 169 TaxID=2770322 RepID=UPI0016625DE3|nr:zeta toxin family protein [Stenotrophomonas sp. 169]QNR97713.1 zeta toxin family protein [Stenotrophomonas sp. 169]